MGKFVLLFSGGGMPETEEEQAAVMAAWGAWYEGLGSAVVDPGNPFSPAVKSIGSNRTVRDVGALNSGYTILNADSMDTAVEMGKKCPILDDNGQVTIYETFDM